MGHGVHRYFKVLFCVCVGGKLQAYFYVYFDSISLNIDHSITTIFHNAMVWYHGYSALILNTPFHGHKHVISLLKYGFWEVLNIWGEGISFSYYMGVV